MDISVLNGTQIKCQSGIISKQCATQDLLNHLDAIYWPTAVSRQWERDQFLKLSSFDSVPSLRTRPTYCWQAEAMSQSYSCTGRERLMLHTQQTRPVWSPWQHPGNTLVSHGVEDHWEALLSSPTVCSSSSTISEGNKPFQQSHFVMRLCFIYVAQILWLKNCGASQKRNKDVVLHSSSALINRTNASLIRCVH